MWFGEETVHFESVQHQSRKKALQPVHALLDEADVVVHFNGGKFDVPILNREFLKYRMLPPTPYKQVDLYQVVKHAFKFERNSLEYVTEYLGLHSKHSAGGFKLWVRCMKGDPDAWATMTDYNKNDVTILGPLYERLRPWITKHPNLWLGQMACPKCGSTKTQARGVQVAVSRSYQRYQCQECGGWFRSSKAIKGTSEHGVNIAA